MSRSGLDDTLPASDPPAPDPDDPSSAIRPPVRASIPPTANGMVPPRSTRYQLGAELGRGGMGRVVEAYDTQLGRTVALKEVLPRASEATERRFRREVQVTARLEHPSIVPLYDSGIGPEGRPYYVMRRVSGRPLDELVVRARGLDERLSLLPALLAAIEAVAHAHRRGVIHRDLKPANILVGELGETIVIDWGLAKVLGEPDPSDGPGDDSEPDPAEPVAGDSLRTQIGSVFGTPGFMSPEQARGELLDAHGDVYALGACLYQLLAGAPPHAGTSATEMLANTMRHDVKPLAVLAPGAPGELVAIVDKALAYAAAERYPDAGALAEDVRRFLTGQLVAAHHYTSMQRVGRFARRFRATLAVAAFASVAVAVLAWYGVSRIVTERDLARRSADDATHQRATAELASAALRDRQDELIIAYATNLLDSNPTQAAATLKQLLPSSKHLVQARATAQGAVARGTAWAIETGIEATSWVALSADGSRFAQVTRDGTLRLFDLDRHRELAHAPIPGESRVHWLGTSRLLVVGPQPGLVDASTGRVTPLDVGPITYAAVSHAGDRAVATTPQHHAILVDLRAGTARPLPDPRPLDMVAIGDDGTWYALGDATALVVYDAASDVEIARHLGAALVVAAGPGRTLAMHDGQSLFVGDFSSQRVAATWTRVPIVLSDHQRFFMISYLGDALIVPTAWNTYYTYAHGDLRRYQEQSAATIAFTPGGQFALFNQESNMVLALTSHGFERVILPIPASEPRTTSNDHRLVAISHGAVLVFDLDRVRSVLVPAPRLGYSLFVGPDTLASWTTGEPTLDWIDVATAKPVGTVSFPGLVFDVRGGIGTNTVLVRTLVDSTTSQLWLLHPRQLDKLLLGSGPDRIWGLQGMLAGGHAVVVYSLLDATVRYRIDGGPERELVKLDGTFVQGALVGPDRIAVLGERGELVLGTFSTGAVERHRVTTVPESLASDGKTGILYAVHGAQLLEWQGDHFTVAATLPRRIARLHPTTGGFAIDLEDAAVYLWSTGSRQLERIVAPSFLPPMYSADGDTVATMVAPAKLELVDLKSRATWTFPVTAAGPTGQTVVSLSADGERLVQPRGDTVVMTDLPRASDDLAAWLDEATNATVAPSGQLLWPFDLSSKHP